MNFAIVVFLMLLPASLAQTPSAAPSAATGICKDGSYTTSVAKDGACRGHKGVQTWYNHSLPSLPAPTSGTMPSRQAPTAATSPTLPAPSVVPSTSLPAPASAASLPSRPAPSPLASPASRSAPVPASIIPSMPAPQPGQKAAKTGIAAQRANLATMPAAEGGGPGLVWVNTTSKVYHCPGSDFYGKTKSGAYMSEADAKAQGAHPNRNKPCT